MAHAIMNTSRMFFMVLRVPSAHAWLHVCGVKLCADVLALEADPKTQHRLIDTTKHSLQQGSNPYP